MRLVSRKVSACLLTATALVTVCAGAGFARPLLEEAVQRAAPAQANRAAKVIAYRRLTESQYRHAIADIFGPAITINARFEPERREERLQAVGNARQSITTSGLEQYYATARSISDQVLDGDKRNDALGCAPSGPADAACAETFIKAKGQQLFRRPLSDAEIGGFREIWAESATGNEDFHKGMKAALVAMLMSPEFLFRVERAEADPARRNAQRLDAYTKAARVSYLLWDTGPDAELLEAARTGQIHTPAVLNAQVDRLLASPKLEDGVRALFTDILQFEYFETISKDGDIYPKFSQSVATSAREETLRFLVDHLVHKGGDYRDIFTSRDTHIDRTLAYVYNVPFLSREPWAPYTFAADAERSGVLTQVTFLSLFAHPGSSSPTIRGAKLQEIFRCIEVPQPPPDVDFSKVQAIEHGTVRVRLTEHMTNPGCAGCHELTDPAGLALERFDGLGQFRRMENGQEIDVNSVMEGAPISGAAGLGRFLHDDPEVTSCLVRNVHYYGVGRVFAPADLPYLTRKEQAFRSGGYQIATLFKTILTDPEFYKVPSPEGPSTVASTAQRTNPEARRF